MRRPPGGRGTPGCWWSWTPAPRSSGRGTEKVARDIARVARVPGFRPGKAPVTLIRRRFAEDIQGEVVQSLVPEYLEKALDEKKMIPVTRPEVEEG